MQADAQVEASESATANQETDRAANQVDRQDRWT